MRKIYRDLWKATLFYAGSYIVWTVAFRLLALTLLTYLLISTRASFQDISDAFSANELTLLGIGTISFILLLFGLHPLTTTTREELFSWYRIEHQFMPGLLQGSMLAAALTVAFLIAGFYKYVGFFIQFEDAPLALLGLALRVIAILGLVLGEEYVFHLKIQNRLRTQLPDLTSILITSLLYMSVKLLQIDLGWLQSITLFLISVSVGLRAVEQVDILRGAGYFSGLLLVFHTLLSLPVLGSDFQGLLMVKFELTVLTDTDTARLLTGGAGGPLSSVGLQLVLLFDIGQRIIQNKKMLGRGWLRRLS